MMLDPSHLCLVFPNDTWLPSRGLLLEVNRDASEVSRLLMTWRSSSISSDGDQGSWPPAVFHVLRRRWNFCTMEQLPNGSHIYRGDREVLCCIQPSFHTAHRGLLVQSQLYAATGLRSYSAFLQNHEMQRKSLGLGRGNMDVRRGIQVWESLWQLYRWNRCQMLIVSV